MNYKIADCYLFEGSHDLAVAAIKLNIVGCFYQHDLASKELGPVSLYRVDYVNPSSVQKNKNYFDDL